MLIEILFLTLQIAKYLIEIYLKTIIMKNKLILRKFLENDRVDIELFCRRFCQHFMAYLYLFLLWHSTCRKFF